MQSIGVIEERRPEAAYALPMGEVKERHDRRGVLDTPPARGMTDL
jgi:hypothetical protein